MQTIIPESDPLNSQNYVYLYRDNSGNILYIGRGKDVDRSLSHTSSRAHNEDLASIIKESNSFSIQVAGPFANPEIAAIVESALISALSATPSIKKNLKNKVDGLSEGLFRPIGVPPEFASRAAESPLLQNELKQLVDGRPVLLVYVTDKTLRYHDDDREGVDLAHPPSEAAIRNRMVKWWQLDCRMDEWKNNRKLIPAILVAVSGTPKHRIIVGSLEIDQNSALPWKQLGRAGCSEVPVCDHRQLDFGEIRGRRLTPDLVRFGSFRSQVFKII